MQVSSQVKSFCCNGQVKWYSLSSQVKSQLSPQVIPSRKQASFTHFLGTFFGNCGTFITLFRHRGVTKRNKL